MVEVTGGSFPRASGARNRERLLGVDWSGALAASQVRSEVASMLRSTLRGTAAAFLLLACHCGGAEGGMPSALARYPRDQFAVEPTGQWSAPGLRFYRVVTIGELDHSSVRVVAVDEHDTLVEGSDLFVRFTSLPADELARRACVTLVDGCTPLAEADPGGAMWVGGDATRIHGPRLADGQLVMDVIVGDMSPSVVRMTIDVASGTILSRETLPRDPASAPPAGVPPQIRATVGIDGGRFVTATLESAAPAAVVGCVSTVAGTCFATVRVPLDADAMSELAQHVTDVLAIPLCEPAALVPGDLSYTLSWPGAPRSYEGPVPADESTMAARGSGPCRADARLAWWIARWVLSSSRAASDMPAPLTVTLDASGASGPRFVNATVRFDGGPPRIVGCTAAIGGSCRATHEVVLDATQSARLYALVEDVRAEPCHVPFPAGAPFSLAMGLTYDGRCGADPALAWWVARTLDPAALTAPP